MAPLSYQVRSVQELVHLVGTFDRAFPEPFLMQQAVRVEIVGVSSLPGARIMESVILPRVERYHWEATNLPSLRSIAHLAEMLASTNDYLESIVEHLVALPQGGPLPVHERMELFHPLEELAFVVLYAARSCMPMVRAPATTFANHLKFFARNASSRAYLRPHIISRAITCMLTIADIMELAPPLPLA